MKLNKNKKFDWRKNLRLLRTESGLTGAQFAGIMGIGYPTLTKIEKGIHSMTMDRMNLILEHFNITLEDFCTLDEKA